MTDEQQAPTQSEETLEAAQQRAAEFEAKWKRALADYQNREKDIARERAEFAEFASASIIRDILPLVDGLRAAAITDMELGGLLKLCDEFLKKQGVESVGVVGERVDYLLHEVVGTKIEDGKEVEIILEIAQLGYRINGRLLRPAKVIIGTEVT